MLKASNLAKHEKICTFNSKNEKKCVTCDKVFYTYNELFKNSRICGKFICFQCDVPFLSAKALDYHILTRHRHVKVSKKAYKCAICKKICLDRKELYSHRLNQHGGNDNIQDIPHLFMIMEIMNYLRYIILTGSIFLLKTKLENLRNCITLLLMIFTEDTGKLEDILQKYITNKEMPIESIFHLE